MIKFFICCSPPPPKAGRFELRRRHYNGDISDEEDQED